jgi:phospholipid-binding lipoprotein MlaA
MKTTISTCTARLAAVLMLLRLAGCAKGPVNPRDPLEPFNRKALEFNEDLDAIVLKPVATVYRVHVPAPVRTASATSSAT